MPFAWRCPFHGLKKLEERVAKRQCLKELRSTLRKGVAEEKGYLQKLKEVGPGKTHTQIRIRNLRTLT